MQDAVARADCVEIAGYGQATDPLLKERDQLITKATPAPTAGASGGAVQQHPGGLIATPPPRSATTRPIEAVTPPIAVPPLNEEKPEDK